MCSSASTTKPSTSPSEWPSAEMTALARRTSTSPFGTHIVHGRGGVQVARIRAYAHTGIAEVGVVRQREHVLDANVPVGVFGGGLSEPEVGGLVHGLEPLRLVQGALQLELALLLVSGPRQLDRHEPPRSLVLLGLDYEMRHALLERVDDDVRQLAVHPVGAADAIADLEAHVSLLFTPTGRAESTGGHASRGEPRRVAVDQLWASR